MSEETLHGFAPNHNYVDLPLDERAKISIDEHLAPARKRSDQLLASYDRAPIEISTEHVAQQMTTLIGQFQALIRTIELAHDTAKQPWLDAGRVVDGIANTMRIAAVDRKQVLEQRLSAYQTAKAAAIIAERAKQREQEADDPEPAWQGLAEQDKKLVSIRSDHGATAHLADDWEITVADVKKVPKRYMTRPKVLAAIISEVRADIKKGDKIAGITAEKGSKSRVRRGG